MKARSNQTYGRQEFIANPNSAGPWTDWRPLQNAGWPIEFAVILDQGDQYTSGWESYQRKVIYQVKNRNILPNYGTTQNLTAGNNLLYKFTPARWLDGRGWQLRVGALLLVSLFKRKSVPVALSRQ